MAKELTSYFEEQGVRIHYGYARALIRACPLTVRGRYIRPSEAWSWWILSWSSGVTTVNCSLRMKSALIPRASGMPGRMSRWISTASAVIWAALNRRIRICCTG